MESGSPSTSQELDRRDPACPRYSEEVARQYGPFETIERRAKVDIDEFQKTFRDQGRPVVMTAMTENWPLMRRTWEEVASLLDGCMGAVQGEGDADKAFGGGRAVYYADIGEFIRDEALSEERASVEFAAYLGTPCPDLLADEYSLPPYYSAEDYLPPRLWIGPPGIRTPLHRDLGDNFLAQVFGTKEIVMVSPDQRPNVSEIANYFVGGQEPFNIDDIDSQKFPNAARASLLRLSLHPGETLFIPEGWFHEVRSDDPNFSLTTSVRYWRTPEED